MYHLDPNINTAIERQADRMRAVRALRNSSNTLSQQTPPAGANGQNRTSRIIARVTLALAAAAPIMAVLVWVLTTS